MYDYREIASRGSCIDYAEQVLHVTVRNGRCAAVWRQGERDSVAINREKWYDHVTEEGGGLIELCEVAQLGGISRDNEQRASELLGEWLGLAPMQLPEKKSKARRSRFDELIADGYRETAVYNYTNADGVTIYAVHRLEHPTKHKEFLQGTPHGWGLGKVEPVLYNLPLVIPAPKVYIVEGEKDCGTLSGLGVVSTTNSGGARKWQESFAETLRGKAVVVIADNDDAGQEHARIVANSVRKTAASVKVITPSKLPKGDITDFIRKEGGKWSAVLELEDATPEWETLDLTPVQAAKEANREPFRNYHIQEGDPRHTKHGRLIRSLITELHTRLLGAPYKVGEVLFDQDRDSGEIVYLLDAPSLFSWIARKTGCVVDWATGADCVNKQEFFAALRDEAKAFSAISGVPDYPPRGDVFYTFGELPEASEGRQYFRELCAFFLPDGPANFTMLKCLLVSPLWYRDGEDRPMWVIDSRNGQGSGKSKVVEMLADLYSTGKEDSTPIDITLPELDQHPEDVIKRIISPAGRNKRILRIDNATGLIRSTNLAQLTTSRAVSGRASYGRNEESRPNNLTYIITANGASSDTDIANRAFPLFVLKPEYRANWASSVRRFISENRLRIFADMVAMLTDHRGYGLTPRTRTPTFEAEVLEAVSDSQEEYAAAVDFIEAQRREVNTEADAAARFIDEVNAKLAQVEVLHGSNVIQPARDTCFIHGTVLEEWFRGAQWVHEIGRNVVGILRGMAKVGAIDCIDLTVSRYPKSSDRIRRSGILWTGQEGGQGKVGPGQIRVIAWDATEKKAREERES